MENMTAREFRDRGYLSEVNRKFLHPLGLAMYVNFEDVEGDDPGTYGIHTDQEDPEGFYMGDAILDEVTEKAFIVQAELNERSPARIEALGFIIQPLEGIED